MPGFASVSRVDGRKCGLVARVDAKSGRRRKINEAMRLEADAPGKAKEGPAYSLARCGLSWRVARRAAWSAVAAHGHGAQLEATFISPRGN